MTALSVGNAGSLVTRTIEQSKSKDLMLRELFQNALEATATQTAGRKKIQIRITDPNWFGLGNFYSTKKFGIFNTGPGLSASKLRLATDLSSSIAKTQGIHANFGEGGKVACLPVNKSGMIWVSCCDGEVNMVVLRLAPDPLTQEERYERQDFALAGNNTSDVINITSFFNDQITMNAAFGSNTNPSGLDTTEDWTYITLCGNDPKQNTTENPYGSGNMTGAWAINELYKRFSIIPADVEVRSEIHSKKGLPSVIFPTVIEVLKDKATKYPDKVQIETISIPELSTQIDIDEHVKNGTINITYVYDGPWETGNSNADKPTSVIGNNATCPIFSGVIYKDEIYDIRGGNEGTSSWQVPAKECGILYGFKHFRVFVHIPTTENIVTDRYRTELQTNTFDKKKILFTDYKHEIYNNMPSWFRDKMSKFAPKPMNLTDVHKELQELMQRIKLEVSATKTNGSITIGSKTSIKPNRTSTNNRIGSYGGTNSFSGASLSPLLFGKQKMIQQFPNIVVLSEDTIKTSSVSANFKYKAAEYATDRNILFINSTYYAVDMIKEDLLNGYIDPSEEIENLAYETSINLLTKLIGTGLIYGLAKQGKPGYEDDFEKAIDPACLSTHADRWIEGEGISIARKHFEKDLKWRELTSSPKAA